MSNYIFKVISFKNDVLEMFSSKNTFEDNNDKSKSVIKDEIGKYDI